MSVAPTKRPNTTTTAIGFTSDMAPDPAAMETDTTNSKFTTMTRVLHININGSLSSFDSRGHTAGMWSPVEGKHPGKHKNPVSPLAMFFNPKHQP
jgi:hypothetical protein